MCEYLLPLHSPGREQVFGLYWIDFISTRNIVQLQFKVYNSLDSAFKTNVNNNIINGLTCVV